MNLTTTTTTTPIMNTAALEQCGIYCCTGTMWNLLLGLYGIYYYSIINTTAGL